MHKRSRGPVLLIEGPCMNNPREYRKLTRTPLTVDGRPYPRRVAEYAEAVFRAVVQNARLLGD